MMLLGGLIISVTAFSQNSVDYQEFDLKNGLHVILHEDHSTPIVAVTVMYHVGSKNEDPSRTGMAHFFEHLLFEGSENIERGEFSSLVENAGGTLNANTSNDRTFYYEVLPSNQLELGLWLESERMLHAKVEIEGINTQREVVKEEKRQRVDNQPYGKLQQETMRRVYTEHPYRWTTIGSLEHLNAATEEEFQQFYRDFYVPNNAVLSIAGDFNMESTKELVKKYFSGIPKSSKEVYRPSITEPAQSVEVRDTIWGNDRLPLVVQAYHIPARGSEEYYAVDMLNLLLSRGESSRLNKSIVEDQELALFCGAFSFGLEDPGLTMAFAMCNMGVDPSVVETAMDAEIERIKNDGLTDREFQKLRNQIENSYVSNNGSMAGIAENLAYYHTFYGAASHINTEMGKYLDVTQEDIIAAAKKYYVKGNRVVLYFLFVEEDTETE